MLTIDVRKGQREAVNWIAPGRAVTFSCGAFRLTQPLSERDPAWVFLDFSGLYRPETLRVEKCLFASSLS
jgi:hypothetical protein